MKKLLKWLGHVGTLGVAGAISTAIVAIVLLIERDWASKTWDAIVRCWHWLGRSIALPHWLFLALVLLGVSALWSLLGRVPRHRQPDADLGKIAQAIAWRAALVELTDTFLTRRAAALEEGARLDQEWLRQYRELRLATRNTYDPIAAEFRAWIRRIPEEYLGEYQNEPVWFDVDSGPDDSANGLVEKLWMPVSLPEAIAFWEGWEQHVLQRLMAERIDLVDDFVRRLKDPIPRSEYDLGRWYRLRRWARRRWRRLRGKTPKKAERV